MDRRSVWVTSTSPPAKADPSPNRIGTGLIKERKKVFGRYVFLGLITRGYKYFIPPGFEGNKAKSSEDQESLGG
ncbi:MAG: hypothetical protein WCA84_05640 [Ignavibacteriaceae bacterium]